MHARLRFIAMAALYVALASGAQAVDLSRYKYTIHVDSGESKRRQLDLELIRTFCRDDDGCLVILSLDLDDGTLLKVTTTRLILKGAHRWMSEIQENGNWRDNDHAVNVVLTTAFGNFCDVSDEEEAGGDDSDDGFSIFISSIAGAATCVVTFVD